MSLGSKHETKFVPYAGREVEKYEHKCKELLMNVQPEESESEGEEAPKFRLPQSLFASFRDIVLFLLCTLLSVTRIDVDSEAIKVARARIDNGLRESEGAFLRMTEHAATDLDQIGYESISTAETLLGLVLENALSISLDERDFYTEHRDPAKPYFNILNVYNDYTSTCVSPQSTSPWHG